MPAIENLRESSRSLAETSEHEPPRQQARLAFASFLMLFVELALIRWTAANNVYVNNATNFVLLASFLGIGVGFLSARSGRDYLRWTPLALVLLVAFELAFPVILSTQSGPNPYQGLNGMPALPTWEHYNRTGVRWGYGGTQEHVREVVCSSGDPADKLVFVEGLVEQTLPTTRPGSISLLRLDTDLYRSTYLELVHLFPLISAGGILMLDDYGGFQGVRAAVDQYFEENKQPIFLSRINAGVRLAVKLRGGV